LNDFTGAVEVIQGINLVAMNINFTYKGCTYKADLAKEAGNKIVVKLDDKRLGNQFGPALRFSIEDKKIGFNSSNRSHSDLFALQCSIKNAIAEQAKDILYA
jgi:hypothetical protein